MTNKLAKIYTQNWKLPFDLQQLIELIEAEAVEYADRAKDVQQLGCSIANGDHRMGIYQAKQIVERQQQFRNAQENGLPAELQHLIAQMKTEAAEYVDRACDVQHFETSIAKGDHRMGVYQAKQIIERQRQFRDAQQIGLPAELQHLIAQMKTGAVEYADQTRDVQQFEASIAKGDHRMGLYQAKQIIERQQQFRNAQENGLPAELQHLITQMKTEAVEYVDRAYDVQQFEASIANGDHRMGVYQAKRIVERQQQFRNTQQNGLPTELQHLITQMKAEAVEYPDRAYDLQQLDASLTKSDHRMGVYNAKKIIERQVNVREHNSQNL